MRISHAVVWCFVISLAVTPGAQQLYVPAAAHTDGVGGAQWRTDLELAPVGGGAAITVAFLRSGQANPDPGELTLQLAPGTSTRLVDVVGKELAASGTGAIRITETTGSVLATSRTYNDLPDGTYGQFIPARRADEAIVHGQEAVILQLARSTSTTDGFRTNIGFVNTSGDQIRIEMDLHDFSGEVLGRGSWVLAANEHRQFNDALGLLAGDIDVADGYAVVRTTTTDGTFFAYGSVVDNRTGDPMYVPAQIASPSSSALVADHLAAAAFDDIPTTAVADARSAFDGMFYGHTSHGSQVVTGLQMLAEENAAFAAPSMHEVGDDLGHAGDLSWVQPTRDYLDTHPGCPLVMWSWCGGVSDNTVAGIDAYLAAMSQLESDYPDVVFVYMTGHLDGTGPDGTLRERNEQIRAYCRDHGKALFDFADIESYDPDGTFHPWEGDWCDWCTTWCQSHDCPSCDGCAHSHCFNCYLKGRAFWWLLARAAGWQPSQPDPNPGAH